MNSEGLGFEVSEAAKELLSPEKLELLKQSFAQIDSNHDGQIVLEEYLQYLLEQEKEKLTKQFKRLDANQDGCIEFEEFLMATEPDYNILKKFREFDTDGNGLLSFQEALRIVEQLYLPVDTDELKTILQQADNNGDQQITFYEFLGAITRFGFQ
ncbi:MAG: EF-hand domain-containing protein [Limnoraphis robusta]|jgi:Ca2+-binding EF-hand superfamily protein|uniref:Calcium-binding protein n=2 Tax=Limnoraphis robusta TaxID=1118279 RepID=A0A0F5Y7G3_9CYAN|nr:EF-hand domain-containing protein [Limnoraphis robusta]MCG5057122.1 EF-hand domain-containing protein [Limnoraphis sp. WC205]KKD34891.1 calcium-binding protein [Limnoraphis robusta CS-951]MEA5498981.1 EF-hand domain-containing protein [Limnoraphis robusta BA-68 BA1]MEA5518970.1 EF-hand domain-containing protein [Limnoraphis robusta CCNP1315]MEA5539416.1 EF-hand domain-containing protein [Limnoraphis robusta Tam1]